jgi:hypothetical protein
MGHDELPGEMVERGSDVKKGVADEYRYLSGYRFDGGDPSEVVHNAGISQLRVELHSNDIRLGFGPTSLRVT